MELKIIDQDFSVCKIKEFSPDLAERRLLFYRQDRRRAFTCMCCETCAKRRTGTR